MTAEEEFSLLRAAMGGVQYVGESFDKPSAAVRGLLASGDPSQLLHAVPFSDALGLAPRKKYSGRDLLYKAGLVPRNKPGFDWYDIPGFAAEVALDPLWLLAPLPIIKGAAKGLGAGAKAGQSLTKARAAFKVAREAAKVPGAVLSRTPPRSTAAMAAQIRAGKRALVGLRLPFAAEPFATFGEGSRVGAAAVEKIFYGGGRANPLVWMRGLFSHTVDGTFHGGVQLGKDLSYAEKQLGLDAITDLSQVWGRTSDELAEKFAKMAKHHGGQGDRDAFEAFNRALAEAEAGMPKGKDFAALLKKHGQMPADASLDDIVAGSQRMADDFYEYVDTGLELQNAIHARIVELGGNFSLLQDIYIPATGHTARQASAFARLRKGKLPRELGFEPWKGRSHWYRDVPLGSATVHRMTREPMVTGTATANKALRKKLRGGTGGTEKGIRDLLTDMGVPQVATPPKNVAETALDRYNRWSMDDSLEQLQAKFLWHSHLKTPLREAWDARRVNQAGQWLDEAGEVVTYAERVDGAIPGTPISYDSEVRRLLEPIYKPITQPGGAAKIRVKPAYLTRLTNHLRKMDPRVRERGIFDRGFLEDAVAYAKSTMEWESTLRSAHHFLGQKGVVGLRGAKGFEEAKSLKQVWKNVRLGKNQKALTDQGLETFVKKNFAPEQIGDDIDEFIDSLRIAPGADGMLDKAIQTLNPRVQGDIGKTIDRINALFKGWLFVPWPAAHTRNHLSGIYQAWSDGRVSIGEVLAGHWAAAQHIRKGTSLESLELLKSTGMLKGHGPMAEIAGRGAAEVTQVPKGLFEWLKPFTPSRLREKGWTAIDPTATRGLRTVTPEMRAMGISPKLSAPMEAGEEAYALVEFLNRAGYAEALWKKGFKPSEIEHLVKRSQFDYSELSRFEQDVMKKGVLFYTWPRKNLPFTLSKLIERPGGRTAQTFRAMKVARGESEEEYTPSFLRETMGTRVGGTPEAAHFMWQSGLPIEEFNKLVVGDVRRTVGKLASYAHPLLSAGPEYLADEQFFTGRKISDLRPVTGVSAIDRLLHYSPASRVVSEARGMIDARKPVYMRGLNALTGFKTGTYDVEYWRARDLEKALQRELEEAPEIGAGEYQYIREDFKGKVPHLETKLRQVRAMRKSIQDLRKKRMAQE